MAETGPNETQRGSSWHITTYYPQFLEGGIQPGAIPLEKSDPRPAGLPKRFEAAVVRAVVVPHVARLGAGHHQPLPIGAAKVTDGNRPVDIGGVPVYAVLPGVHLPLVFILPLG